jgi:hypothetical protein
MDDLRKELDEQIEKKNRKNLFQPNQVFVQREMSRRIIPISTSLDEIILLGLLMYNRTKLLTVSLSASDRERLPAWNSPGRSTTVRCACSEPESSTLRKSVFAKLRIQESKTNGKKSVEKERTSIERRGLNIKERQDHVWVVSKDCLSIYTSRSDGHGFMWSIVKRVPLQ